MSRYLIIIEDTPTGFSAYSPDLPGCVATGTNRDEIEREMREAIEFHIEELRLSGYPVPEMRSQAAYCEIAAYNSAAITAGWRSRHCTSRNAVCAGLQVT